MLTLVRYDEFEFYIARGAHVQQNKELFVLENEDECGFGQRKLCEIIEDKEKKLKNIDHATLE